MRLRILASLAAAAVLAASACSNDYDEFTFVETPGAGGTGAAGSGGSTTGGTGGTLTGGTGGTLTGGTGGTLTGGTGGTGGIGGTGGTPGCAPGQKLCGTACVDVGDPQWGCGSTGCDPCTMANATTQCVNGLCALFACNSGFGNCDADLSDGCEQTLDTVEHCGACGRACSTTNSTGATCTASACEHQCQPGFGDCSAPASPAADDGCESDFAATNTSCGSCDNDCSQQGAGGGFVCTSAICGCANNEQCRVSGAADDATCESSTGLCTCSGTTCVSGEACMKSGPGSVCRCNGGTACTAGQTCCQSPAGCFDLATDAANCGACGNACATGQTCQAGVCQ